MATLRSEPVEVELRGLWKRFGDAAGVHDLSLTVARGEFFTLLGPSGCGKTTTLRMIAGLLPPDAGEILFDGRPVTPTPPWRRHIGMVFQNYALWPHMTVAENVAFGLVERRVARDEIRRKVEDALALVGLGGLGSRLPSQLSGGQQQRVALARAIVVEPSLLLLDEPLSNLDARLRVQMRHELARLQRQLGITTIYVTHDQEEALMLSTRIAVMHQGRLQQLGTPEDIYERPETIFVADFFGGASFLAGRVTGVSAETVIVTLDPEWGRATLRAATPRHAQLRQDDRVLVGLRTEALDVVAAAGEHENVLPGTLRLVTYRGAEAACEVEIAGRCVVNARLRRRLRGTDMADGTRVGVRVDPGRIILLRSS